MNLPIDQLGYEQKSPEYFQNVRPEMHSFVPVHCRRLLDVGCAEGAFGESLKRARQVEVWGVEPTRTAAAVAMTKLDKVIVGVFGPENALPQRTFDCITFNDVLEHMPTPEAALRYAKDLLAPGGVVVASIPNVRYFATVRDLLIHARWEYADAGILDKTHLRFFTGPSIVNMFEREGFQIENMCGINGYSGPKGIRRALWRALRLIDSLVLKKLEDMTFVQFAVVARPATQLAERAIEKRPGRK